MALPPYLTIEAKLICIRRRLVYEDKLLLALCDK